MSDPGPHRLPHAPARGQARGRPPRAPRGGAAARLRRRRGRREPGRARGRQRRRRPTDTSTAAGARCGCGWARRTPSTARSRTTRRATAASTPRCSRSSCSRTRSASPRRTSHTSTASPTRATSTRRASCSAAASTRSRSCCARRRSSRCRRSRQAGETMPPKSTYFYPKLLSGLLFNPLWRPELGLAANPEPSKHLAEHLAEARGGLEVAVHLQVALHHRLRGMHLLEAMRANVGTEVRNVTTGFSRPAGRRHGALAVLDPHDPLAWPRCCRSARTAPRPRTRSPSPARTRAPSP